jgi:hypothetical protein
MLLRATGKLEAEKAILARRQFDLSSLSAEVDLKSIMETLNKLPKEGLLPLFRVLILNVEASRQRDTSSFYLCDEIVNLANGSQLIDGVCVGGDVLVDICERRTIKHFHRVDVRQVDDQQMSSGEQHDQNLEGKHSCEEQVGGHGSGLQSWQQHEQEDRNLGQEQEGQSEPEEAQYKESEQEEAHCEEQDQTQVQPQESEQEEAHCEEQDQTQVQPQECEQEEAHCEEQDQTQVQPQESEQEEAHCEEQDQTQVQPQESEQEEAHCEEQDQTQVQPQESEQEEAHCEEQDQTQVQPQECEQEEAHCEEQDQTQVQPQESEQEEAHCEEQDQTQVQPQESEQEEAHCEEQDQTQVQPQESEQEEAHCEEQDQTKRDHGDQTIGDHQGTAGTGNEEIEVVLSEDLQLKSRSVMLMSAEDLQDWKEWFESSANGLGSQSEIQYNEQGRGIRRSRSTTPLSESMLWKQVRSFSCLSLPSFPTFRRLILL